MRDFDNDGVYLDKALAGLNSPNLQTLVLAQWKVTKATLLMLPDCFKALPNLELESVMMVSDEKGAWPLALQELAQKHGSSIWISVEGLKHK